MKSLLANMSSRERWVLAAGAVVTVLLVLLFTWISLQGRVERLQGQVRDHQSLDQWMRAAAQQVTELRGMQSRGNRNTGNRSLLAIVDQTAKQAGLSNAIKRIEPEREDNVRVWFEEVAFDDMINWLSRVQQNYGVQVDVISVDRQDRVGMVNARMVLAGSG